MGLDGTKGCFTGPCILVSEGFCGLVLEEDVMD